MGFFLVSEIEKVALLYLTAKLVAVKLLKTKNLYKSGSAHLQATPI
jgi:hypothetical protein